MAQYQNPILRGMNPDPSICRAGDTFYMVTSSFEYFPGLPIYKSTNLADWECIGHVLTRASQLPLREVRPSDGLYAPTLRYHDGVFYCICTNVRAGGNFYVYCKDIEKGDWSDPIWIQKSGIDPSLTFADDKVYFVSNDDGKGHYGIFMSELDLKKKKIVTEPKLISNGCGGRNAEAPHVYKIGEYYYLMLAEGGTEYGHHEETLRSKDPYGPYEKNPSGPILSHVNDWHFDIGCTGHADLVDDPAGNWWLVCLGIRNLKIDDGLVFLHNLGRETFLAPVTWVDGWPVVGDPQEPGTLKLTMEAPLPGSAPAEPQQKVTYSLSDLVNRHALTWIRNPIAENYRLHSKTDAIRLGASNIMLQDDLHSPTFVGIRQQEFRMSFEAKIKSDLQSEGQRAGVSVFYDNEHHYDLFLTRENGKYRVQVRKQIYDLCAITANILVPEKMEERTKNTSTRTMMPDALRQPAKAVRLKITADQNQYYFYAAFGNAPYILLDSGTTAAMATEITRKMTFTGTFLGLFTENCNADASQIRVEYAK